MATRMLRRGLPRVRGGEPWPPGIEVAADTSAQVEPADATPLVDPAAAAAATATAPVPVVASETASPRVEPVETASVDGRRDDAPLAAGGGSLRRGLPRVSGGEPWPPAGVASGAAEVGPTPSVSSTVDESESVTPVDEPSAAPALAPAVAPAVPVAERREETTAARGSVRRGLPRVAGGDPWPPAGTVPSAAPMSADASLAATAADTTAADTTAADAAAPRTTAVAPATDLAPAPTGKTTLRDTTIPLSAPRTVWNGSAPRRIPAAAPASGRPRPTWTQAIAGLVGAAALGILAAAAVAFVRALLSFPFMQDFLAAFPGEYTPAVAVEPGFAPWVNWAHFFNVFLMVLIIRSGLRIRNEKRPTAFWTPRGDPKGKVSLTIWFHQALDVLWLVNGVIFVVLLFVTGHWVRIVPTSWEVIPNALSAALQYISFDWPTEHGWVNYNSLQQLAYFVTVFIAAPLAAATGIRMSGMWPKKAERLSKAYPIEWARAVHFPVMIYFVVFIIGHVALVFLTGFLRNLNHMYASSDAVGWTGFWVFVASLVVIAVGWVAARPLVIAPIAKLFGSVSGR